MTRPAGPFANPVPPKLRLVKRDTPDEAVEKRYARDRDRGCVADRAMRLSHPGTGALTCEGPLEVDHVRASGGLGMKSETHRRNLVTLCRFHHRAKTEYGRVWRPLLLDYLARVEVGE